MVESGDWGRYHGPHLPNLCRRLSDFHNVEHVLPCSSGTAAMEMALRGVGVQEGDEVVMAAYDFKSNFQNVLHLKALPVLVDLDPVTWQLEASRITPALSPRTRAILISHLHGGVVNAPQVRQLADSRGIAIVEDACQNPGAMLYGRRAAMWGDVGIISFGGSKLITAGRGGAVLTNKAEISERIKRHVLRGNDAYPLSEIQAAILLPQIDELDSLNERRRRTAGRIIDELQRFGLSALQTPTHDIQPVYYKVGFHYGMEDFGGLPRERFVEAARAEGIAMDPGFRSNHLIHASRRFRPADDLIEATRADTDMVTLYHPVLLEDEAAIKEVVDAVHCIHQHSEEIKAASVNSNQAEAHG
jgi:dTDP-4-amino-4,6-dideoxygalactose transaminase